MAPTLPEIGTRISLTGSLGTVRYVGAVDGTQGVWLGIEWDDPNRGKHDGVKDGRRYFSCLVPNSGSFVRPTATISYGVSFLTALTVKYIEAQHGPASLEKVTLGSSRGAIEVEAVGLDKVRSRLARLERLQEASLDGEAVSKADPSGDIARTCPDIRGLDLSRNLIPTWKTIASITAELQSLRSLCLNQNRLQSPIETSFDPAAFRRLEELQLNGTMTTWHEFQTLLLHMPTLRTVELGYNRLRGLSSQPSSQSTWAVNIPLQIVNLDGNELYDFLEVCSAVHNISGLQRLILTANRLERVNPASRKDLECSGALQSPLSRTRHLAMAFNRLSSWSDIDALQCWCPELESLTLAGNPLFDDPNHASYARAFTIAKIPSLKSLDGAAISPRERTDCELLYLSHINKRTFASEDEKRAEHPQWDALSSKHGVSDAPAVPEAQDTLSNRLITIQIHHSTTSPSPSPSPDANGLPTALGVPALPLRVLPTMSIRTFRLKALKSLKVPRARHAAARLWLVLPGERFVELGEEYAGRDLAFWGVEEGTRFVLVDADG